MCRLTSLLSVLLLASSAQGTPVATDGVKFFEAKVRPLLVQHCQDCHGADKKKGGLRLDNLAYILTGGERGPGLIPHPEKSLIFQAVRYDDPDMEMPPDGKLADEEIEILRQWIAMGAPWPQAEVAAAQPGRRPGEITEEDRQWWSFLPVKKVAPPMVMHGGMQVEQPIDAFVIAKLQQENLQPSPPAGRVEMIRRLSFNLTGLPPTPEAVEHFLKDDRADAYERLVDELLASSRYGERWAQHWLDLVRYAESDGYRLDSYRPNAWPYRDYVIKSFNDDKPYDRFMKEQIAGDEIAPGDPDALAATGFLRHSIYEYNQRDAEGQWKGILNEVTDVTTDVFMGVSVQCAQCHDHKFDPILQKDYYRLQAFLNNITWAEDKWLVTPDQQREYERQLALWKEKVAPWQAQIDAVLEPRIKRAEVSAMEKFPEEVQVMWKKPREQRTPYEEQVVQLAWRQADYERDRYKEDKLPEEDKQKLATARAEMAKFQSLKPRPPLRALTVSETGPDAAPASFFSRRAGKQDVTPGVLSVLETRDAEIPPPQSHASTSGRRTVLAEWLARADNPLTTRVIVNRVWQQHFGRGLAASTSDFGKLGEKPTHPELLDWLTAGFVENGWSLKWLHKQIVMSQTYRQTTRMHERAAEVKGEDPVMVKDPENRWLWRFSPRRLDAEQARDAALLASGELDLTMGGEGVEPSRPRRSIYTKKLRNTQDAFLASLDAPAGFQSIAERASTTTATQSLLMINGDWPLDRARAMSLKLSAAGNTAIEQQVQRAFHLAYSRLASSAELKAAVAFVQNQMNDLQAEQPAEPVTATPLAEAQPFFGDTGAAKTSKTILLKPGSTAEKLRVPNAASLEPENFTIEAMVYLDSLYPDASVRTIVSRWGNGKTEAGWALGVTSEKSAHKPNNLILQLNGEDFQGSRLYEVVASDLRIPLKTPYYVGVSLSNQPAEGEPFGGTATFYARDLSNADAPLQSVTVRHQVCGDWVHPGRTLYVGGREIEKRGMWDGAIARVALRVGSLEPGKLMAWVGANDPTCILDVNADQVASMLKAPAAQRWAWESTDHATAKKGAALSSHAEALADLCHVLLNSNEFLYLQ
jgi:mono/diheme cytochrome c family protein